LINIILKLIDYCHSNLNDKKKVFAKNNVPNINDELEGKILKEQACDPLENPRLYWQIQVLYIFH